MASVHRQGDLDTSEDMAVERREWRVQRIGWVVMFLFLAAGLAGLFGSGPLAHAEERSGALTLGYDRFARQQASAELEVHAPASGKDLVVWLGGEWISSIELEAITPEPAQAEVQTDRLVYRFHSAPGPVTVRFQYRPERVGRVHGRVGVDDGAGLAFAQVVFP